MTARQHLNRFFQLWITLAQNLIQLYRVHPRFLKLREGTASLYALMLTNIAHKQNTIIPMEARKELVHLPCGRKRGFIQHIKALLSCIESITFD
jgi:hypothetical protein